MTAAELRQRWERRRDEWSRLGVSVDGAKLATEIIGDLEQLEAVALDDKLTLNEAATHSGYSADHLRHLLAAGQLENVGRKHAPRVRRVDLPRKPGPAKAAVGYDADRDALRLVGGARVTGGATP